MFPFSRKKKPSGPLGALGSQQRKDEYDNWVREEMARRRAECAAPQVSFDAPPLPIDFALDLLVIADTHNSLTENDIPDKIESMDACFLLGDMSPYDMDVVKRTVVGKIPVYGVLGNHDNPGFYEMNGIEDVHGRLIEINGVKVVGMQGSIAYKDNRDGAYCMMTDNESVLMAANLPYADILISHDAPKYLHGNWNYAHSGLQGITDYLLDNNVPLNLHGHHHVNTIDTLQNGTTSICCYRVQEIQTEKIRYLSEK